MAKHQLELRYLIKQAGYHHPQQGSHRIQGKAQAGTGKGEAEALVSLALGQLGVEVDVDAQLRRLVEQGAIAWMVSGSITVVGVGMPADKTVFLHATLQLFLRGVHIPHRQDGTAEETVRMAAGQMVQGVVGGPANGDAVCNGQLLRAGRTAEDSLGDALAVHQFQPLLAQIQQLLQQDALRHGDVVRPVDDVGFGVIAGGHGPAGQRVYQALVIKMVFQVDASHTTYPLIVII